MRHARLTRAASSSRSASTPAALSASVPSLLAARTRSSRAASSVSSGLAPAGGSTSAPAPVAALASRAPLVVVHKSTCGACRDLLERLEDADVPHAAVALDGVPDRAALAAATGQAAAPYVFLGGAHVPAAFVLAGVRRPGARPAGYDPAAPERTGGPPCCASPSTGAALDGEAAHAEWRAMLKAAGLPAGGTWRP